MSPRAFRRGGGGKKRDAAERPILDVLRAYGARCFQIGGTGLPDVLVLWLGTWTPLEVKSKGGRLTVQQQDIPWAVVSTPEQALTAIGATK